VLIGSIGAASAGDRALLDVIGYSPDGRHFAFEEFGIQDGSGFPYSAIYVVDLVTDSWVTGTPVRVLEQTDGASVPMARTTARADVAPILSNLAIETPAETLALIGDGIEDDAQSLLFGTPGYNPGATEGAYELMLEHFPVTAASPCADWFGQEALGYRLTLSGDGPERVLHEDDAVPRSRGCPFTYRLHSVHIPFGTLDLEAGVAIIASYPGGFEGPDRRFLAVPLR
jgi:predicted secreted protein